ncbi:MAG: helix-turn-helix transcriptional regulator [Ruminococcaceae bacterium]|nr:helix-turn-helix transcriptional regulator [Oscillospiraceae bacterium]MBQ2757985.1 helix-turn-helix transcriptional regulator [Clostridia bacterium]
MKEHVKGAPCCTFLHAHDAAVEAVRQIMPPEYTLLDLAEFFHIFGDSTRIKILYALAAHELCVCDIAALLGMTISAISHQLRILKAAKMVRCRRSGKTVFYSLADEHVHTILNQGFTHITEPS